MNIRIPRLREHAFYGFFNEWVIFQETFNSIVPKSGTPTSVQNFHCLRSTLHSEALQVIKHILITEGNYECGWELLCKRYENKKLMVTTGLDSLLEKSHISLES